MTSNVFPGIVVLVTPRRAASQIGNRASGFSGFPGEVKKSNEIKNINEEIKTNICLARKLRPLNPVPISRSFHSKDYPLEDRDNQQYLRRFNNPFWGYPLKGIHLQ